MSKFLNYIQSIFFISLIIFIGVFRYLNQHLTESELFFKFWYMWIIIFIIAILMCFITEEDKK